MTARWRLVVVEFAHHLPYTIVSSLIAMAGVWWFGTQQASGVETHLVEPSRALFHMFHPLHICLSAIATTSLFWRHSRRLARTLVVGALGTIVPCGLSDYFFPYWGGLLLGQSVELHVCVVDHPLLFFPYLTLGLLGGFLAEERMTGSSVFSHAAHIFVSSVASLLYLISVGLTGWMTDVHLIFPVFLIIVVAVWIPCCISDIVIPAASVPSSAHHR
jgi:hypothetical protein